MTDDHSSVEAVALKACPFCGGTDAFVERADLSSCYVACNDCGARGPSSCDEIDADASATEAGECEPGELPARRLWGTRPVRQPISDEGVKAQRVQVAAALARHPDSSWDDYEWEDLARHVRELFLEQADLAIAAMSAPSDQDKLDEIGIMMSEFVDNWPTPRRFSTALELIAKTFRALLDSEKDCPSDIAAKVLEIGVAEWGSTPEHDADGHAEHIRDSVRLTAERHGQDGPQEMHGLYIEGTETIICHTGTSPNSPDIARALTGAWNWMHARALLTRARQAGSAEQ